MDILERPYEENNHKQQLTRVTLTWRVAKPTVFFQADDLIHSEQRADLEASEFEVQTQASSSRIRVNTAQRGCGMMISEQLMWAH